MKGKTVCILPSNNRLSIYLKKITSLLKNYAIQLKIWVMKQSIMCVSIILQKVSSLNMRRIKSKGKKEGCFLKQKNGKEYADFIVQIFEIGII